jgi:hypothetical protein
MPVKINRNLKEPECSLYGPDGTFLGVIDSGIILNDVRLQIKRQKLEGYYILFKNHIITIHSNGRLNHYPDGFYDTWSNQLFELIE